MIRKFICAILLASSSSASWAESCYPISTPRLVFSAYFPLDSQPQDIETVIDFSCAPAFQGNRLHVRVSMQAGSEAFGYQLKNNVGDILRMSFFIDPARSIPLTSDMSVPVYAVNFGAKTFSIVLYGRIPPNQRTAGVGQYRGFVNLQLSY
ncbi:MAG: hypothetical protein EBV64_06065 [Oxalobacteraceae bacterium]|jgi:Spore Coat Protein U domain|nr:hypothetical protein [Oxalobacteraceae bacterium]